eukprot:34205-Chlamydomonas_euryale.AAC.1
MQANAAAPARLAALMQEWMWLLSDETDARVAAFAAAEPRPGLDEYRAELDRLGAAADAVRSACTNVVVTGLYAVRTSDFKELMCEAADALRRSLLDQVRGGYAARVGGGRRTGA